MSPEEWLAAQSAKTTLPEPSTIPVPAAVPNVAQKKQSPEEWLLAQSKETVGIPADAVQRETDTHNPDPGIINRITGAQDAALTMFTAATGGTAGLVGGVLNQLSKEMVQGKYGTKEAADRIEKAAADLSEAWTRSPKTEIGQEIVKYVGEMAGQFIPLTPMASELRAIGAAARPTARSMASTSSKNIINPVANTIPTAIKNIKPGLKKETLSPDLAMKAIERQKNAEELPIPIKLTKGQKERTFEQQRFEKETAKLPEQGAPLRDRFADQNMKLQQNIDTFIDQTGAEITDVKGIGEIVDKAIRSRAAADKNKIRSLYKKAEKAGEMDTPVILTELTKHLAESAPEAAVANVLNMAKKKAIQLGAIKEAKNGELIPQPISLKKVELLRRSINASTNAEPTNIRQSSIMKNLIDSETEGTGGNLYKQARKARWKYAKDYENIGIIKKIWVIKNNER